MGGQYQPPQVSMITLPSLRLVGCAISMQGCKYWCTPEPLVWFRRYRNRLFHPLHCCTASHALKQLQAPPTRIPREPRTTLSFPATRWIGLRDFDMATEAESPKREPTPTASLSSIPQKRALDEGHSPAVSSPLNPDGKAADSQGPEDGAQINRSKSARAKKETFKKREAKGADSSRATPEPKTQTQKEPQQAESSPLRYKLAPPKPSDFEPARGPVLTSHHKATTQDDDEVEFFETSDQ